MVQIDEKERQTRRQRHKEKKRKCVGKEKKGTVVVVGNDGSWTIIYYSIEPP